MNLNNYHLKMNLILLFMNERERYCRIFNGHVFDYMFFTYF
jgi:hypothetical protein